MLRCDSNGFQNGDDKSSWWDERCLQERQHSDAQVSNGTEKEYVESVVKSESYLEDEELLCGAVHLNWCAPSEAKP